MSDKFEDKLQWKLPISRFNVGCGFYGDSQWQLWNDGGEYVEYADHQEIVNIYAAEVARLQGLLDNMWFEE